jgi:hypothetical protein
MYDELMGKLPVKKSLFSFRKKKADEKKDAETTDLLSDCNPDEEGMELSGGVKTGGGLKEFFGDSAVKNSDNDHVADSDDEPEASEVSVAQCCAVQICAVL